MRFTAPTIALVIMAAAAVPIPAHAQTYYARQKLEIVRTAATTPAPNPGTGEWTVGEWSKPSSTCSDKQMQTRSVSCTSGGQAVADSLCSGTKPESSMGPIVDHSGCGYEWKLRTVISATTCTGGTVAVTGRVDCYKPGKTTSESDYYCNQYPELVRPAQGSVTIACQDDGYKFRPPGGTSWTGATMPLKYVQGPLPSGGIAIAQAAFCDQQKDEHPDLTGIDCYGQGYVAYPSGEIAIRAGVQNSNKYYDTVAKPGGTASPVQSGSSREYYNTTVTLADIPSDWYLNSGVCSSSTNPNWIRNCR
jgi:hypothetical protein